MSETADHIRAMWNRTPQMRDRLQRNPLYEEPARDVHAGYFAGRHIIARETPISQGVYLGAAPREAIVVDDRRYTAEYNGVYSTLLSTIYTIAHREPEASVLSKILVPTFTAVRRSLPYDLAVSRLTEGMYDQKINLGAFLREGGGVCRHQALLAGYLLERLRDENELLLDDQISVDRNYIPGKGGHAWVRYAASDGTPYIIDPAQQRVDSLDRLQNTGWDYRRPEEV